MQPEQIVEALNGMGKTPEGQKQVQQLMQQFQQELQGQQAGIFKDGGKLHDFICKHAKGGHIAGCGCKEEGGKVSKAQNGTSGIPQNASALDTYLMSNMQMPTSDNLFTGQQVANLINSIHLNQPLVQAQEDGGKVEKAQYGEIVNDSTGKRRVIYHPEGGYAGYVDLTTGKAYNHNDEEMLQPGWYNGKGYPMAHRNATRGNAYEVNTYGRIIENLPEGNQRVLPPADSANFAELVKQWDMSKIGHAVTAEQNGGEIKNLQLPPKDLLKTYSNSEYSIAAKTYPDGTVEKIETVYPYRRTISINPDNGQQDTTMTVSQSPIILSPYSRLGRKYGPGMMDSTGNRVVTNRQSWRSFNSAIDEARRKANIKAESAARFEALRKLDIKPTYKPLTTK